ncbi:MAG: phenylalanine--tRNA ligase subunit beta [bacterium]|nr:phenylalanine--tRNA ligase subunit beta [bacterium]
MLISYNWLKEYIDFDFSPQELAAKLTDLGFETANLEKSGDDTVIDLELTVNRGDCLSMIGMAREISAITHNPLKMPSAKDLNLSKKLTPLINVSLVEPKLCPRYTGRIIDGVHVTDSPSWLCDRLKKAGIRSINNVVDITNFVLMELGHPLHAFDYQTLLGGKIIICRATSGEKLMALDGTTYELSPEMLIIADAQRPVALAGIIGGEETSVKKGTTTIFLECAYFNPTNVRQTARQLGIQTESSYRFERGVDPDGLIKAQNRATQLIMEICQGKSVSEIRDDYPKKFKKTIIDLTSARVNKILGTDINSTDIKEILRPLGFGIKEDDEFLKIEVPSFRHLDISREIDVIEEIARVYGYDKIPTSMPSGSFNVAINREYELADRAKEILVSCGFYEVITYVFSSPDILRQTKIPESNTVVIDNPLRTDENLMCPSLIPNILKTIAWNINRANYDLKIFELGRVFSANVGEKLPREKKVLVGAVCGNYHQPHWRDKAVSSNLYDLKGVVEKLLLELGLTDYELLAGDHPTLHPARQIKLVFQGVRFGIMGELHPEIAEELKILEETYLFELDWDNLVSRVNLERRFKSLPRYPAVQRDIAILVKEDVPSAQITGIIENAGKDLIEKVSLFDVYQGDKIPAGYKSLAYSVTYRKPEATLTDEEVNEVHNKITLELKNTVGVERSPELIRPMQSTFIDNL